MLQRRVKLGPRVLRLICPAGLTLLALGLMTTTQSLEAYSSTPLPLLPTPRFHELLAASVIRPDAATPRLDQARVPVEFQLVRGETVSEVLERLGLEAAEAHDATNALAEHVNLRALRAGNRYSAFFNPDSTLASFELTLEGSGRVAMSREADGWSTAWQPFTRTSALRALGGRLDGSLDVSIRAAGGPHQLAYKMADILQWDLDFTRDLHAGDRFEVLYEEVRVEGVVDSIGTVYAVALESRGRRHEAYRWNDSGVYYDGEGRPLEKMFLRSPMRYSNITSRFSHRRFHPVLKKYRPHYGVDYGAPVGTPARVTANGVVASAGWDRGGGKVVKVRHAQGYLTAYLHLSRFAKGVRAGTRVRQGDIIGYVGATGLATGPHLDYRVQHNSRWIDPLSLTSVRDEPIPSRQLASFRAYREELRAAMATGIAPRTLPDPAGLDTAYALAASAPREDGSALAARRTR
ncbi:MAG TPA: peptidoglycan DD-metalloendopeptidase family protein [Thermoanaerobaculia bacterium]|nr:peptidoglycan DD-metalloendopeptidase family protein [Thermoanaerobaculia bacterium]